MPVIRLELLPVPELHEADGRLRFKVRLDKDTGWQPDLWRAPVYHQHIAAVRQDPKLAYFEDRLQRLIEISNRSEEECRWALREGHWNPAIENEYVSFAHADFDRQLREPICSSTEIFWLYRNQLVKVVSGGSEDELILLIKHKVLSHERALDKIRREVEAFENFETLERNPRPPIPRHVQMFVWQRDAVDAWSAGAKNALSTTTSSRWPKAVAVRSGTFSFCAKPATARRVRRFESVSRQPLD